jgi:hypothetical protein
MESVGGPNIGTMEQSHSHKSGEARSKELNLKRKNDCPVVFFIYIVTVLSQLHCKGNMILSIRDKDHHSSNSRGIHRAESNQFINISLSLCNLLNSLEKITARGRLSPDKSNLHEIYVHHKNSIYYPHR